jgi:hypothetical protein
VLGDLTLQRAYYVCEHCGASFFPRDKGLGCGKNGLSPAVERMVAFVAATVSFEESAQMLAELAGVDLNAKQVERTAEKIGEDVAQDEIENAEPGRPNSSTMYMGIDGTGTPMRPSELTDRKGKQDDGSAKTREAKLATIWTANGRTAEGIPERDRGSASYSAAIESAACLDTEKEISPFAARVGREAQRRGFIDAQRQVILGDGAPWIWKIADELFPAAIQIVDRFHAKEHLANVAKDIFGTESKFGLEWMQRRFQELDDGLLDEILAALKKHSAKIEEARKCIGYIERNAHRMQYRKFREMGLCTSTGIVEAGCKIVVGIRCKRAGMRWTLEGANAIMALRCYKLSERLPGYWERLRLRRAA